MNFGNVVTPQRGVTESFLNARDFSGISPKYGHKCWQWKKQTRFEVSQAMSSYSPACSHQYVTICLSLSIDKSEILSIQFPFYAIFGEFSRKNHTFSDFHSWSNRLSLLRSTTWPSHFFKLGSFSLIFENENNVNSDKQTLFLYQTNLQTISSPPVKKSWKSDEWGRSY